MTDPIEKILPLTALLDFRPCGNGKRAVLFVSWVLTFLGIASGSHAIASSAQQPPFPRAVSQGISAEASSLLQRGRQHYQQGQFFEAASLWERAASLYADRTSLLDEAQTLNYLALAYHKLGDRDRALDAITTSLEFLQQLENLTFPGLAIFAQALNVRGTLELESGQTSTALETWKQAEATYDRAGDLTGKLGSQINQAQALQTLGQYRSAKTVLEQLVGKLSAQPDSALKVDGLRSLGVALQTIGDLETSQTVLEQSWQVSDRLNLPGETSKTLFSIGNVARDLREYDTAIAYYQQAEKLATDDIVRSQAQLNQFSLWVARKDWENARALLPHIQQQLSELPPSRAAVYARVNLAASWMDLGAEYPEIAKLLASAIAIADRLQDRRSQAYALTELAHLYERNQQWQEAQTLTEQALQMSQAIQADDITAPAAWQLGRIFTAEGNAKEALTSYNTAFETLQGLRRDLVAIGPDVQFDFKESVEPVYRELVSLLLQPGASPAQIDRARQVMEALQIAQLDNFFRDACLDVQPVKLEQIDAGAAAIYPIVLDDRLETILSLPDRPLQHYTTPLSGDRVEAILQKLRSALHPGYSNSERLQLSQQVYDWLIRPAEAELERSGINTLVFIPDGGFGAIPMAVLHDGDRYLVEKYSTAISPGLQLFPQGLHRDRLTALTAGLTEARQGFSPLPGVEQELEQITTEVNAEVLLDRQFTRAQFQAAIDRESYPVIHLATHGQFSSDPADTFLLTWDDRINIKDFDNFFRKRRLGILKPIELLVMSACQTATGDKRATLGLAGFALRSGARSTLASLWSVHDRSTAELMSQFYRELTRPEGSMTKANALRQAQLSLLNDPLHKHPYFWGAFILVGNWL